MIGYTSDDILWSPANPNFCINCDTTTVRPTLTTRYYAVATNSFNCSSIDSFTVKVVNPFTAIPLSPDATICEGERVQLDVAPKDKLIVWSPAGSLSNSNIFNPMATPLQSTNYVATLTDSLGCFSSSTTIHVIVKSKPMIDAGPDRVYPYNTTFRLTPNFSENVRVWLWAPADSLSCHNCPTPITNAVTTKTYTVTAISDSGCVSRDAITVFVECKDANLLMPNAFTPNNDNINDRYRPVVRGIKNITRFAVYNRQGQLLFEQKDFMPGKEINHSGWDGRYKGQQMPGAAYVYMVEAICDIGKPIFAKGSFILIR
jgi:gliding motility-associated-like protein